MHKKYLNQLHAVSRTPQDGFLILLLRHSVHHFPPNYGDIECRMEEPNAALCLDTRAKKWKYKFK